MVVITNKLTKEAEKTIGLDKKVQIFWDEECLRFETEDKKQVDIQPLGIPAYAVIGYSLTVKNEGYCPYLGETSYSVTGRKLSETSYLAADKGLIEKAKYFCLGGSYSTTDFSGKYEAIIVPVALYCDKETKGGGN